MESHCIPFTRIPQATKLFVDTLYNFSRVEKFYSYNPFDPASFSAAAKEISLEASRRSAVADVLGEQNRAFGGDQATEENIRRLKSGEAVAVVTGQQVGLFGGPAYSVYKALTAVRLAQKLTADGLPAVPVFWLASEDHDFEEVNHCSLLDSEGRWRELCHDSLPSGEAPVGTLAFDGTIQALRERAVHLWPRELAGEAQNLLAGYSPNATYAQAFARLFHRLFAGQGLVILDPLHPLLHSLSRPILRRVLQEGEKLHRQVRERDRQLRRAGYHAQVRLRENGTLLFLLVDGRRVPLRRRRRAFALSGESERSLEDLVSLLDSHPERFSANVLLRPLVQDWLLPTVAYVAGPNEGAYLAQSGVLYQELLGRMPVIYPRASLTLVEPKVRRLLEKYRLELPDLFAASPVVRARLAERRLPPGLLRRLQRSQAKIEQLLAETAEAVQPLDPTLAGATETSRRKMLYQYDKIRRKTARAQAEREGIVDRHHQLLTNALYPGRGLQERKMNFLSIVARQGQGVVPRLLERVNFPCPDHQVILL